MRTSLQKVLDELLEMCDDLEIKPRLLYPCLQLGDCLSQNEVDMIEELAVTSTQKLISIFTFLKPKSDNVFLVLQKTFYNLQYLDLCNHIETKLKEADCESLIWKPLQKPFPTTSIETLEIRMVRENLKEHYQEEFEILQNYWQKFNVRGNLKMDTFYNHNIIIRDNNCKFRTIYESTDQLFSTNTKRLIITGDAGYGKSTFVHEMTREWVTGEKSWTKKFLLLFLIRLTEVGQIETQSLQALLGKCVSTRDIAAVSEWLENPQHLKSSLFIFDGLDELQHQFCKDVNDIIFGNGNKHPYVVVTTRPCDNLKEIEKSLQNSLYVELKGFTIIGIEEQLKTFKISLETVEHNFMHILKVPLFNTVFCITHKESPYSCLNICTAIEKFVQFACNRYRKTERRFTKVEEDELLLILGQAAQNKFSLIHNTNIEYPKVTPKMLIIAKETGLVFQKSTAADFVFSHQTIAEYCAAFYWCRTNPLTVKAITKNVQVTFANPLGGSLKYSDPFSQFLSHLHHEYKLFLWQHFENYVPLLDEYESLPIHTLKENKITLSKISFSEQNSVLETLEFEQNSPLYLFNAHFETGKMFENLSNLKCMELYYCTLQISPVEFFRSYDMRSLHFYDCKFLNAHQVAEKLNDDGDKLIGLEELKIWCCNLSVVDLLSYILRHCAKLKTLILRGGFLDEDSGIDCILELRNNPILFYSIAHFELTCSEPAELTTLFEILGNLVNLNHLDLEVARKLNNFEVIALKLSLENRSKKLVELNLKLHDETGKKVDFKRLF